MCKNTRLGEESINSVLACIVNHNIRHSIRCLNNLQGNKIIVNFMDYVKSQINNNFHKYIESPFIQTRDSEYSISNKHFKQALVFMEGIYYKNTFRYSDEHKSSFFLVLKSFILEMSVLQLVLYQVEKINIIDETNYKSFKIVCTLPEIIRKNIFINYVPTLKELSFDNDDKEETITVGNLVFADDLEYMFSHMLNTNELEYSLHMILGLGRNISSSIDIKELLQDISHNPEESTLQEPLTRLWLLQNNIVCMGGKYDKYFGNT